MYLIIPISEDSIVHHISVIDPVPSDHYIVCCKVLLPKPSPEKKETAYRNLKCIDFARFRKDIRNLNLLDNDITSIADLVEPYNAKLASLFDDHARVRNKVVTLRPKSPWFTPEIREQKMKRRRLERRWQKTRLTVDREIYTQQCTVVHRLIRTSKASYYTDRISELKSKPSDLFRTLETLLKGRAEKLYPPCNSTKDLANLFADYFERKKIVTIRADLDLRRPILQDPFSDACFEHSKVLFRQFTHVSEMQLEKLVIKFSR